MNQKRLEKDIDRISFFGDHAWVKKGVPYGAAVWKPLKDRIKISDMEDGGFVGALVLEDDYEVDEDVSF